MKIISLLLILFFSNGIKINSIRTLFEQASTNESSLEKLINNLNYEGNLNPTLLGYKGATITLKAKYTSNPYKKLKYFNEGKSILESAINSDPLNNELRYLRFAIQISIPSFLNYSKNVDSDKAFLINSIITKNINDIELETKILNLLNNSGELNLKEKKLINKK